MSYPIDQIKDRITCFEYAKRHLGLNIDRPGARCSSFRDNASNSTSLLIDERHWHDFGMGIGGDVIDLCAIAKGIEFPQAVRELAALAGVEIVDRSTGATRIYERISSLADEFHKALTPADRDYLHGRGITDETIGALKIGRGTSAGMQGRLVIPYWKAGRPCYLVGRGENPKYKKLFRVEELDGEKVEIPWSDHPIWGVDSISRKGPVVIAEGTFDALSAWQDGYAVLSAGTGRFSREQEKDLYELLRGREAVICMDYDPDSRSGQKFTLELAERLFFEGIHAKVVELDGGPQKVDLSDLYGGGTPVADVLANAKPFLVVKVNSILGNEGSLKHLLRQAARFMPWPDLAKVIEHIRATGAWNGAWLRALVDDLKRPPSDDQIVREMAEKYALIYHEQLGWFEYIKSRGVWTSRCDTEIKAYISTLFRHFRSGRRIASAFIAAKAEFIRQSPLNTSPLLNLRNGMLDPEKGELRNHDASYYSTIQLDYNFDPDAQCPAWERFIEDVTDGDERRQMFLQEMFGYCLTNDVRYQVAFFLIGSGSNGKSVLLDVLQAMVGRDNVANVEVSSLAEPFQRISLHGKLINLACETESNVSGTEQIFKQVVAGDPVNGCYKGKDFITFRPFCKCVFAANAYSESSDLTKGFMRRIRFLRFPVEFADNPGKSQKKRDTKITEKLLLELPGILGWALRGLLALRKQEGFTSTTDNTEMQREYLEFNDPLEFFVQEYFPPTYWARRSVVYDEYKDWCKNNNSHPLSARKFWPRLRDKMTFEERGLKGVREVLFLVEKKSS